MRSSRWLVISKWCAILVPAVLVLYPLSVGPALWLVVNVLPESTHPTVQLLYEPLFRIFPDSDTAARIWVRYLTLWVDEETLFQNDGP